MKEKAKDIIFGWAVVLIGTCIGILLLNNFYGTNFYLVRQQPYPFRDIIAGCLLAPVVEEVIFRWAPINLIKNRPDFDKIKWPVIVLTSFVFGYLHGGFENVYVQGFAGVVFSWIYLKTGFNLTSAILLHALCNFGTMYLFPSLVQKVPIFPFF